VLDLLHRLRMRKSDSAIRGDVIGELRSSGFDTGAEIILAEKRDHGAASVAGASVGDDGFEAVADFGPVFVFARSDEKEDAAVVLFASDAELLEKFVAVLCGGFAFERMHGDDGHLRAGFLFEFGAKIFKAGVGVRREHGGEIGNVAGGVNGFDVLGRSGKRADGKKSKEKQRERLRGRIATRHG